jgi:DNA polymerase
MWAFVDIETYGSADLTQVGAFRYAEHPDTELLGLGVLLVESLEPIRGEGSDIGARVEIAHAWRGDRVSSGVITALTDPTTRIVSWGSFDRILLDEFGLGASRGWPSDLSDRWCNGMDVAAACNLPSDLASAVKAIGLRESDGSESTKDPRGERLIRKYSRPDRSGERHHFADHPADAELMFEHYMRQDVALLARLIACLPPLSEHEQHVAEATWQVNRHGVRIDTVLAHALLRTHDWLQRQAREAAEIRHGLNIRSQQQVIAALQDYGFPLPRHPRTGAVSIEQKLLRPVLLRLNGQIDPRAFDLLTLRAAVSGGSLVKAEAALTHVCRDGRVRDMFMYCGTITGRWASRDLQLQNLPRPRFEMTPLDVDTLVELFKLCGDPAALTSLVDLLFGVSLQDAAVSLLRSLIIPDDGNVLVIADYKTIEVVTNWMAAGEYDGLAALMAGIDEYTAFAATLSERIAALLGTINRLRKNPLPEPATI